MWSAPPLFIPRLFTANVEPTYDALQGRGLAVVKRHGLSQLTFPTPLMTPPDTRTYFIFCSLCLTCC